MKKDSFKTRVISNLYDIPYSDILKNIELQTTLDQVTYCMEKIQRLKLLSKYVPKEKVIKV